MPVYGAAKHGLRGWSLICHEALRKHGIKVTLINPGASQRAHANDASHTAGAEGFFLLS